jgi:hypothetical protein
MERVDEEIEKWGKPFWLVDREVWDENGED